MHQIDHITIKGFKSIASIEKLELRPVNILIGANGSGKSNFLAAFGLLHALREGRLVRYTEDEGGAERVLHFGSKTTKEIELGFRQGAWTYKLTLAGDKEDRLVPAFGREMVQRDGAPMRVLDPEGREAGISVPGIEAGHVEVSLRNCRVYHFNDTSSSSLMRKTARVGDGLSLRPDGSNLAWFLYRLRTDWWAAYRLIIEEMRRVAPFFDDLVLEADGDYINPRWRHKISGQEFPFSSLSDGTLRFLALVAVLARPSMGDASSIVLIDEPELGLHPYAIGILAALVRSVSVASQVILSTESPILLDYFSPEEVLVAELVNGATTLTRPDPERLKIWLEDYSLGQLWEKNEIGGRPVPA